jgi:Na+/melibiose symporter-like transporter
MDSPAGPCPSSETTVAPELKPDVHSSKVQNSKITDSRIAWTSIPTSNLEEGIVGWETQDDPNMPLNFSQRKKWVIVGLVSAITFVTPFASSILSPGIGRLNKEFGNTNSAIGTMTVSIYLLGYVVGPLFLAPLSEIYGRKVVLGAANICFCAWQIGCALAPDITSLIVFRFLGGVGGAGCLVTNPAQYF